jgi:leucyl/phenylalanyl-tRNA--protein transferase
MKRPTAELLLNAYAQGIFPMAHEELDFELYWYAPDPRAIIPLDGFHASRRLRQTVRQEVFEIRYSTAFERVMRECAAPRGQDSGTWISTGLIDAYTELHRYGFAHSVEAWKDGELVGGLYGVALRGLFAGESMFHRERDASKVCLYHLVERLNERGFALLDTQFTTPHLERFGAIEIPREEYEARLEKALERDVTFL